MKVTKYTKEILEEVVKNSYSYADVARFFEVSTSGGIQSHLKKRIMDFGICTIHFKSRAWSSGKIFQNRRKSSDEILKRMPKGSNRQRSYQLRRALIEIGRKEECNTCNMKPIWNNTKLDFEIDHIDGDYLNNERENLRFICPNCHSQTSTYKNKKR